MLKLKIKVLIVLVLSLLFVTFTGCEEDDTEVKYYKIYRENANGSLTCWTVYGDYSVKNNLLVCWEDSDNKEDFCITGDITIKTLLMKKPKEPANENAPAK